MSISGKVVGSDKTDGGVFLNNISFSDIQVGGILDFPDCNVNGLKLKNVILKQRNQII